MLSFLVPVFRSEACLVPLYERIIATFGDSPDGFEIIFVEDCGGDRSWDVICDLASKDVRVRGIQMSRNYGQHNALLCAIRVARGELSVTLDDDLQHPPEQVPVLLAYLRAFNLDVVYGAPDREQHGLVRDLASRATKVALQSTVGAKTARLVCAFRVFRTSLRSAFDGYRSPNVNIDVLLTWGTTKFGAVKVPHNPRLHGVSGYTTGKLIRHAMNMMTGFSTLPLQLASSLGFICALFGLGLLVHVLVRWLIYGSVVPGFVFLASIIVIFSGAQLLALGILGEYLARMYLRAMDRPAYYVAATTDTQKETGHSDWHGRVPD